jgi:hypothetical protein
VAHVFERRAKIEHMPVVRREVVSYQFPRSREGGWVVRNAHYPRGGVVEAFFAGTTVSER